MRRRITSEKIRGIVISPYFFIRMNGFYVQGGYIKKTDTISHEDRLKLRLNGIGGAEVAAVCNLSISLAMLYPQAEKGR